MASGTSKKTEIKLINVARASLEELKLDYEDFLRIRGLGVWEKDNPLYKRLTQLNRTPNATYETFKNAFEHPDPAISANSIAGTINITSYLLRKQIHALEAAFLKNGGITENMYRTRKKHR